VTPGDAVWFSGGIAPEESVVDTLTAAGFARVLLPAGRLTAGGSGWTLAPSPPPAAPTGALSVHLVYTVDGLAARWRMETDGNMDQIADAIAAAVRQALDSKSWGSVAGVHLDAPIPSDAAEQGIGLLTRLRSRLPESLLLSASLGPISDAAKAAGAFATAPADAFYATVFGSGAQDPAAVEALGRVWWAGYDPATEGNYEAAAGGPKQPIGESIFTQLTDDPRVEMGHDISLSEVGASGFVFRFRQPVELEGRAFAPGDRITFRQPALAELLFRFGADSAGRRHLRGRVFVLGGTSEAKRVVSLAALSDVLLGRPLDPDLVITISSDASSVSVGAANASPHASLVSRTGNWVEVDVPTGGISDVDLGGFDRFEVFDGLGQAVTLARSTRVKLFETLVSPGEVVAPARISLRNPPAEDCCTQRSQILSAAGPELRTDWLAPTPVPTPTPRPKPARR
jgi:hypothetical protein